MKKFPALEHNYCVRKSPSLLPRMSEAECLLSWQQQAECSVYLHRSLHPKGLGRLALQHSSHPQATMDLDKFRYNSL
jgi:hypothetical protein